MPSGLLQTVLCEEKLADSYDRIDELFYYTMQGIVKRLEDDLTVTAPVDNGRDLTPRQSDISNMTNWKNRLKSKLEDLDVLLALCDRILVMNGGKVTGIVDARTATKEEIGLLMTKSDRREEDAANE